MALTLDLAAVPRRVQWRALAGPATLLAIPAVFVILGLVLRYAAYATVVPDASLATFADGLCRWDCGWYVTLAETGYDPYPVPSMSDGGNWAFFPLLPLLVSIVHAVIRLPTIVVATGVSIALSYATALISWPLFDRNLRAYALFSAYLLAGPFSIYFATFYTEVLFIFLTTAVLVALNRGSVLGAGGFAALLSATRIVGVFAAIAILVEGFLDHRRSGGRIAGFIPYLLGRPELLVALLLAPVGLCAYMAFLYFWMGDPLAFMHVQRAWARAPGNPLVFIWTALTTPPDGWWPSSPQQLVIAIAIGFALTGVLFWHRRFAWATFSLACMLMPLFAGLASTLRFTAALAPVAITGMQLLGSRRWLFVLSLIVFLAGDYFVTEAWLTGALSLV